jgi:hypothetical protein
MLRELRVSELRYRAVLEVLDGAAVTSEPGQFGVSRGTLHVWLRRYAATGGVVNLEDRSSRPHSCPHQMSPAARVCIRRWSVGRIEVSLRRRRRADFGRWERGRQLPACSLGQDGPPGNRQAGA